MIKSIFTSLVCFVLTIQISYGNHPNHLISYEQVATFSKEDLEKKWKENGIPKFITPVNNAVTVYEVIYNTRWHDGTWIKASGFFFKPEEAGTTLPYLNYNHGTQIEKDRSFSLGGEFAICIAFATDGYMVGYPDYVGLGKGDKFHLYQHAETEATASIDLIFAIDEICKEKGIQRNDFLFSTGYSQGGHASLATHKYIQDHPELGLSITASSPMSGAYDMTGAQEKAMLEPYSHPGYLPYLMYSFNEVYDLYDPLEQIFKSPYDSILPPLFNGKHSMGDVNKVMPPVPKDFIKEEFQLAYFEDENFPFRKKLEENSLIDWIPEAPVQLCYCEADEQVYYENSIEAYQSFKNLGAKKMVKLRRGGRKFGHNKCALYTAIYSKYFFDSFLKGKENGKKGPAFKRFLMNFGKIKMRREVRKDNNQARRHGME